MVVSARTSLYRQPTVPPVLERIRMKYSLDCFAADPGQRGALDQPIDSDEALDRLVDRGEGKVSPPEYLVAFGDAIFLRGDQGIPELPWPIEDRRNLAIDVGLLARDHDAFLDPGMRHMRHDQFEVAVAAGDLVDHHGPAQLDGSVLGECRAHMERQRQILLR